jgi:hypothetical protein
LAIIGFGIDTANISVAIYQEMLRRNISLDTLKQVYTNNADSSVQQSGSKELLDGAIAITPISISAANAPYLADWRLAFRQRFNDDRLENALGYDAMYLIALALLQGVITGDIDTDGLSETSTRSLIQANLRSVSGTGASTDVIEITPGKFALAIETLKAGGSINYNGASGLIDFDDAGDVNYGDFDVIQTRAGPDGLIAECARQIRLFPSSTAPGAPNETEVNDCP